MLDLSAKAKKYFEIKIGTTLFEVEPPKMGVLKKLVEMASVLTEKQAQIGSTEMEQLTEVIALILSKNKKNKKVDPAYIDENFGYDDTLTFLEQYFVWISQIQNDPN